MTESDFLESIKNLATFYKQKDSGKDSDKDSDKDNGKKPISWKSATYRALYSIEGGMAADALWMSCKKVDVKNSNLEGKWENDQVSVEIAKTFFHLYLEKYKNFNGLEELIEQAKLKVEA